MGRTWEWWGKLMGLYGWGGVGWNWVGLVGWGCCDRGVLRNKYIRI